MRILSIRPEPPGSGYTVARFNVEMSDDLRLFNCKLVEKPDGRRFVHAPNSGGQRVVTFSPALVDQIANAAFAALKELLPHVQHT